MARMKMIEDVKNWEKEYLQMARGELSKQQIELLEGRDIKSHEGMIFGGMYADWKVRKGYDEETV